MSQLMWNIPDDFKRLLDNSHGQMGTVVDQSSNIVFWHFWKLLLEDTLETSHNDHALSRVVVVNDAKFNLAIAFLCDSWLEVSLATSFVLSCKIG